MCDESSSIGLLHSWLCCHPEETAGLCRIQFAVPRQIQRQMGGSRRIFGNGRHNRGGGMLPLMRCSHLCGVLSRSSSKLVSVETSPQHNCSHRSAEETFLHAVMRAQLPQVDTQSGEVNWCARLNGSPDKRLACARATSRLYSCLFSVPPVIVRTK